MSIINFNTLQADKFPEFDQQDIFELLLVPKFVTISCNTGTPDVK